MQTKLRGAYRPRLRGKSQLIIKFATLSVIFFGLAIVLIAFEQEGVTRALSQGVGIDVKLKNVVKVLLTKDKQGYLISYEYNFPQRQWVYIKGIGTVPAKGKFRYLTSDSQLEFRDRLDGEVLVRVPLQETVIVAATPPLLPTPDIKDFPKEALRFDWVSSATLQERAQIVLNKYFRLAQDSDCVNGSINMTTTFAPLEVKNLPPGTTAQIALLLSYPCITNSGKYSFKMTFRAMEGRTHSDDYRQTKDSKIIQAASSFVRDLVSEMNGSGAGQ
jgi:hypothetical protein